MILLKYVGPTCLENRRPRYFKSMIYLIYDHMFELVGPSMLGESEPRYFKCMIYFGNHIIHLKYRGLILMNITWPKYLGLRRLENVRPGCLNGMTYSLKYQYSKYRGNANMWGPIHTVDVLGPHPIGEWRPGHPFLVYHTFEVPGPNFSFIV